MKKLSLLFFFILTGCSFLDSTTQQVYEHPIETFEYSERCPNVCWAGIHPGTTKKGEVRKILKSTTYIENRSIDWDEHGVDAVWTVKYIGPVNSDVGIVFEDDVVSGIVFTRLYPITVDDLIQLLGEPEATSIFFDDVHNFTSYDLFYSSPRMVISSWNDDISGPQPNDEVQFFSVDTSNEKLNDRAQRIYDVAQPWLGYGHFEEYLPDADIR